MLSTSAPATRATAAVASPEQSSITSTGTPGIALFTSSTTLPIAPSSFSAGATISNEPGAVARITGRRPRGDLSHKPEPTHRGRDWKGGSYEKSPVAAAIDGRCSTRPRHERERVSTAATKGGG